MVFWWGYEYIESISHGVSLDGTVTRMRIDRAGDADSDRRGNAQSIIAVAARTDGIPGDVALDGRNGGGMALGTDWRRHFINGLVLVRWRRRAPRPHELVRSRSRLAWTAPCQQRRPAPTRAPTSLVEQGLSAEEQHDQDNDQHQAN